MASLFSLRNCANWFNGSHKKSSFISRQSMECSNKTTSSELKPILRQLKNEGKNFLRCSTASLARTAGKHTSLPLENTTTIGHKHCISWTQTLQQLDTNTTTVGHKHCNNWTQTLQQLDTNTATIRHKHNNSLRTHKNNSNLGTHKHCNNFNSLRAHKHNSLRTHKHFSSKSS